MLRVLIILTIFFGVLADAAHVEAHASGQHSHDTVLADQSVHEHDSDHQQADLDDDISNYPANAEHKADHAAGHNHVVGDRSLAFEVIWRAYSAANAKYRTRPELALPSAPSAPLLEPPSA